MTLKLPTRTAGPVTHGRGPGDAAAQARHFTSIALRQISQLMEASEDEKLRFACAKYLLETGWGRPGTNKPVEDSAPALDPELQERIFLMIDRARSLRLNDLTNET